MYKKFFGLREEPFKINPDPRYLFPTPQTEGAWDQLRYGLATRRGLCVLTGEVGTGKTTLIHRLIEWLRQQYGHIAFIFNSHLEPRHLLDYVLADFGVPIEARTNSNLLMCLRRWLLERYRANQIAVLIVDEAQGLSLDLLEEIRLLLNLETPADKLLQVVLVGQPELEETLRRRELRQLWQRIAVRCRTAPLTREQTHEYIRARLRIAGSQDDAIFTPEAADSIHYYARGIPRVINLLCEHSLINAYVDNLRPIPARIVEEVARELECDDGQSYGPLSRCEDAPDVRLVTTEVNLAKAVMPPLSAAQISPAALPIAVARPSVIPICESTSENTRIVEDIRDPVHQEAERALDSTEFTSKNAFRLLGAWTLKSQSIPSASPLRVVRLKADLEDSQSVPASPVEISAPRSFSGVKATQSFEHTGIELLGQWLASLNRWSASWKMRWHSMVFSPEPGSVGSALLRWLRSAIIRWQRERQRSVAWLLGSSPMGSPRSAVWLIRWLHQPWG